MSESSDPRDIHTIAVTLSDVVAAVELNRTSDDQAVLRITPPFSGRMRARLHVERGEEYDGDPEPVNVNPDTLLEPNAPAYPRPAETEDELRADPDETYTVERHHERHAVAVEAWRSRIGDAVCDQIAVETTDGPHELRVAVLDDTSTPSDTAE